MERFWKLFGIAALVIIVVVLVLFSISKGQVNNQPIQNYTKINETILRPLGMCTVKNKTSNISLALCSAGQRFENFKLLKVYVSSAQILVYNTCYSHSAIPESMVNTTACVKIINLSINQSFTNCYMPRSKLLITNYSKQVAVFGINMSAPDCIYFAS